MGKVKGLEGLSVRDAPCILHCRVRPFGSGSANSSFVIAELNRVSKDVAIKVGERCHSHWFESFILGGSKNVSQE